MAHYDNGAYIKTVLEGNKADATDMHSLNARVLGCDRDTAKIWFYAFIYGAGDAKLGSILGASYKRGKASRQSFLEALPALGKLVRGVQARTRERGFLLGLDGRHLPVRSEHAALNTLLQSSGAIFMKKALVLLDEASVDLDILGRESLLAFLKSESVARNVTVIYCTHIFDGLDSWGTELLFVTNGTISTNLPFESVISKVFFSLSVFVLLFVTNGTISTSLPLESAISKVLFF
jgi:hypothetical protein